ncbi:tetraacyldisaccharide 4'-kinase [Aequorivita sp. SDUM287046]|uniref:Tetraacyldisaccharide 4'-kinase n=1 Tax=Aequorivita aurantiaca TaxID=3053356 RepID=A0ABT8DGQ7_9FLAO|nr:tetraacyldisaccharide 4'-kinase [Aequorivita aurantiaca]MDN3724577.1 tetraacyldisaccharide 4'-kinase [Aequorivita aurantiaca]
MDFLRKLLFPFSLLYGGVTALRNLLYNIGILQSKGYDVPIICVGNLSTGGTGKSPMIELLVSFLESDYHLAILSRGYKRKTTGYREVSENSSVAEVGDEPLQFKKKFPRVKVAVCEDRQTGIEQLRQSADVILLDDAFQHRKVKASLNILLTAFDSLFSDDYMLPSGNLREPKCGMKRAHIIVVTKCPENLSRSEMEIIKGKLKPKAGQEIYFSKIGYSSEIKNESGSKPLSYLRNQKFTLVTGIANPKPLVGFLKNEEMDFELHSFPDHHNFSDSEIEALKKHPLILTTEKDFMRLQPLTAVTEIHYLPIRTVILYGAENSFKTRIFLELPKKK